jgi:hypothetical protein
MKYTLNVYGYEGEFICKDLSEESYLELIEIAGDRELSDVRYDLEKVIDVWDGDKFKFTKALDNESLRFELLDESNNKILEFGLRGISDISEFDETLDETNSFVAVPEEEDEIIYLSVDESKGGVVSIVFESDSTPTPKDFSITYGSVETPDGDWDFIDKYFYLGTELEIYESLDNRGKNSSVQIFKFED